MTVFWTSPQDAPARTEPSGFVTFGPGNWEGTVWPSGVENWTDAAGIHARGLSIEPAEHERDHRAFVQESER
jgi:hypothetical protein